MDMSMFITFFTFALFCFTFVFWLKQNERKYKYTKAKMVDLFIKRNNIHVTNIFVGSYFDLVNDKRNKCIWFFYVQKQTLQYKQIPYANIHQIEYKIDGVTIQSVVKSRKLKRDLLLNSDFSNKNIVVENKHIIPEDTFRVKEVMLTILIDELKPVTLDLIFISSHLPIEWKNVKNTEVKEWYYIFTEIIKREEHLEAT